MPDARRDLMTAEDVLHVTALAVSDGNLHDQAFYRRILATDNALAASQQEVERLRCDAQGLHDIAIQREQERDEARAQLAAAREDIARLEMERRNAVRFLTLAVFAAGGRVRITKLAAMDLDNAILSRSEDFETGDTILTARYTDAERKGTE